MKGVLLVTAQFILIVWLLWPFRLQYWGDISLFLAGSGTLLAAWSLSHNYLGNFNIRPEPMEYGTLITTGPYRFVRHPMYTAVLMVTGGSLLATLGYSYIELPGWCLLAAVLWAKTVLEEQGLRVMHPEYADYAARVKRFVPWVV